MAAAGGDNYGEDRGGSKPDTEEEAEERTDGWMTTYADLVTLLLTFFVLMFALSNVDQAKFALFAGAMSEGGMSQERFEEIMQMYAPSDDPGEAPLIPEPDTPSEGDILSQQLADLYEAIQDYIEANELGNSIMVQFEGDLLLLTLSSDIVFPSNVAVVTEEMRIVAGELAQLIALKHTESEAFEIIVTGHTDNVPPGGGLWRSNWQLSANRAINFLEVILEESSIAPEFFYASGFGEHHPIDTNNTPEGRQRNRRVEVLISPLRLTEYARIDRDLDDSASDAIVTDNTDDDVVQPDDTTPDAADPEITDDDEN